MARPMLDDLELQQVQTIEVDGDQVWIQHDIPALEGDFFQGLGRRASQVTLTGILTGADVADGLKNLRDKFQAAAPVTFVTDIATATRIDQVLIEEMGVREVAGKPSRFEYAFTLREYIPATPPGRKKPPPPEIPPKKKPEESVLEVEVIVDGQPDFDHSQTRVRVTGTSEEGQTIDRDLNNESERQDNVWTVEPFPSGSYTAEAATAPPNEMTGSNRGDLPLGERRRIVIYLRLDGTKIAQYVVLHYWFDKAFIEPCMRPVMRQIAEYANGHPGEKLLIIGHTDLVGSDQYNQSLSERRARSAYAYLTFGRDQTSADTAVSEWDELRKPRTTGVTLTVQDTWGPRQYQQMLQELGFYKGAISDTHDTATDTAVRAFQADNGLSVDGVLGDQSWPVLIRAYLSLDSLAVSDDSLLPNAKDGCDGGKVKWIGHGEKDPFRDTEDAWRPNRRTEFLFVKESTFPTAVSVPKPVTFELPALSGSQWCLGGNSGPRSCYVRPHPIGPNGERIRKENGCSLQDEEQWERHRLDVQSILIRGSIRYENGSPVPNAKFVLTSPEGEFLHTDDAGQPDLGERPSGPDRGRPIPDRADDQGKFNYPEKKPVGVYSLELIDLPDPQVVRLVEAPPTSAKGKIVCKRLEPKSDPDEPVDFDVIVMPGPAVVDDTSLEFVASDDVESLVENC